MTLLSLASVLAESARRTPDRLAVVQGDLRVGYADLWRQARQHATALQGQGIGPGDRVALLAPNVADFVRAYYGILAAGAVVVPVPTLLNADGGVVHRCGTRVRSFLLYDASFAAIGHRGRRRRVGVPPATSPRWAPPTSSRCAPTSRARPRTPR